MWLMELASWQLKPTVCQWLKAERGDRPEAERDGAEGEDGGRLRHTSSPPDQSWCGWWMLVAQAEIQKGGNTGSGRVWP